MNLRIWKDEKYEHHRMYSDVHGNLIITKYDRIFYYKSYPDQSWTTLSEPGDTFYTQINNEYNKREKKLKRILNG